MKIQPPETLLERDTLNAHGSAIIKLVQARLRVAADGDALRSSTWSAPEAVPERQSIRVHASYLLVRPSGRIDIATVMFPYDPQHKTFLNFYETGDRRAGNPG